MKALLTLTFLFSIFASTFSNTTTAERKQRPFNDEGPICKEGCNGSGKDKRSFSNEFQFELTKVVAKNEPKPPFNDEGPGGNKG
ncbi:hypothetical protein [Halobacteriovorax sp. HLS]|uniref:hypothetical protein n=1 Tax=Halobacteriovorax sp. HLS TaxID=2234000 RepID=UPI000FDCA2B9|nr:hypothetical protein [Halobacteriovorax sp. HLS]